MGREDKQPKQQTRKEAMIDKVVNRMPVFIPEEKKVMPSGDKIKPGAKVNHKIWGQGIIVASLPKGDDFEITVAFDSQGIKKLSAKYAPLEFIR